MENKELLNIDRTFIHFGRKGATTTKYAIQLPGKATEFVVSIPSKVVEVSGKSFNYGKNVLGHISEARGVRDLGAIGLYEVRVGLMGIQENISYFKDSALLDTAMNWMVSTSCKHNDQS